MTSAGPPGRSRLVRALRRRAYGLYARYGPEPPERPLPQERLHLPDDLIGLDTRAGNALLAEAAPRGDYARLAAHFIGQRNPEFCGPATIAMVLNSIGSGAGGAEHDQDSVFTRKTEAVKRRRDVVRGGMGLDDLAGYLRGHGLGAELHFASATDRETFRAAALSVLDDPRRFAIVNYFRPVLGQAGGGHTSPLAAYHAPTDRFLVLDVARHCYPPIWVETGRLFAAMDTLAAVKSRGFVIVTA